MQRHHELTMGAEPTSHGIRFRLWAPAARRVTLWLEDPDHHAPFDMMALGDGWFELETPHARAGSLYRYQIDSGTRVPDPASRFQPQDVHGPSQVIDPHAFDWQDGGWRGRPWEEAVLYELHVGSFTGEGTYAAIQSRLDHLVALGITAIELMPLADFSGRRNWGYDGVLPYAPDHHYGTPEQLKQLIQQTHARGLMVFLDVVYNHFGPEGNYLDNYAPPFFSAQHHTPWGKAINFDGEGSAAVRRFFIDNALYWLKEYHFDGLRLDAVNTIRDDGELHILAEIAQRVRAEFAGQRQVHLVLENDDNDVRLLARDAQGRAMLYDAQWNDDFHHVCHVLATAEAGGYYDDYQDDSLAHLGRALSEGFSYQGTPSHFRNGRQRGAPSTALPPTAFVNYLQNHDQVGNRALGERLTRLAPEAAVRALTAVWLLAPAIPLLFMGQEWAADTPFLFFCDFHGRLAHAVNKGRRREFAQFPQFSDPQTQARIPDVTARETFARGILDWNELTQPVHQGWLELHRQLLVLRRDYVVPLLSQPCQASWEPLGGRALAVQWRWPDHRLHLLANLGDVPQVHGIALADECFYVTPQTSFTPDLPPWSVRWSLTHHS